MAMINEKIEKTGDIHSNDFALLFRSLPLIPGMLIFCDDDNNKTLLGNEK